MTAIIYAVLLAILKVAYLRLGGTAAEVPVSASTAPEASELTQKR